MAQSLEDFFWSRVNKTETCWLWTGYRDTDGYGRVERGRKLRPAARTSAHRLSWALHCGPVPEALYILHRCDVRLRVNPAHLFLGTQAENVADMVSKDRQARGENNSQAKLTSEQVLEIRTSRENGETFQSIADRFKCSKQTTWLIAHRKTWASI